MSSSFQGGAARSISVEEQNGRKTITSTFVEPNEKPMQQSHKRNAKLGKESQPLYQPQQRASATYHPQQRASATYHPQPSITVEEQNGRKTITSTFVEPNEKPMQQTHQGNAKLGLESQPLYQPQPQQYAYGSTMTTTSSGEPQGLTNIIKHDLNQFLVANQELENDINKAFDFLGKKLQDMSCAYSDKLKPVQPRNAADEESRRLRAQQAKGFWGNIREAYKEFWEGATEMRDYFFEQIESQEEKSFSEKPTATVFQREVNIALRGKKSEVKETLETH